MDDYDYQHNDEEYLRHLREADMHTRATPLTSQDHFQRAQAHALIAIGLLLEQADFVRGNY
jgi:hypothetical protein